MRFIYAHNFRGFAKTVIPLEGVSFFLGENSTGKTSILALINLLNSPNFWFNNQFNSPDHEFGGFKDIISANATETDVFSVGLIAKGKQKEQNTESWNGIFVSFHEVEGLPSLAYVAQLTGNRLLCLRAEGESYKYFSMETEADFSGKAPSHVFEFLAGQIKHSEYKELPKGLPSRTPLPLLPLLSIVETLIAGKGEPKENIFFQMPIGMSEFVWLAPIRTRPRRTYDGYGKEYSPEGEHTPYELRKRLHPTNKAKVFCSALEKFGKVSGLFRKVGIHNLGKGAAAPFELLVTLSDSQLRINSVGYGVSQALPVVVEMLVRDKGAWFAIQQPEVHLHPRAQAALGDLLFQMTELEQKHFVIETHSDFMVDRFRLNMRRTKQHKVKAQVVFFERHGDGNKLSIIPIQTDGDYSPEQPKTFRDFFVKEQLSILGI
jgi:hypothetical protein